MASKSDETRSKKVTSMGEAEKEQGGGSVKFKSRKRSKKARNKVLFREEDDNVERDERPEMTVSEMMILKEAQELREQSRMAALTSKGSYQRPKTRDTEEKKEVDDPIGLKQSFAVEQSSHVAEERMSRYIEERMAEKFKDRRKGDGDRRPKPEDDIYAIPDRLKVEEKPLYDPGEGLPAAGVEEVTLPDEVRLQNEAETRRARKETLRKGTALEKRPMNSVPGNLSANYAKHRSDWMQDNVTRFDEEKFGRRTEHSENKQQKPMREDTAKRRRYEAASDAAVADRFRKRWKG